MATTLRVRQLKDKVKLQGKEEEHEEANSWSNRDLIPLPPSRRTWGWFHYFGYWTINSLNVSNWQSPNTFLSKPTYHLPFYRSSNLRLPSVRLVRPSVFVRYRRRQGIDLLLLHLGRLVWSSLAHWLHNSEQIYLGSARKLHPASPAYPSELHMVCCPMLERRQTDCVSKPFGGLPCNHETDE